MKKHSLLNGGGCPKALICLVAFFALFTNAFAQKLTVKGEVTDANGDPLPGVAVVLKGTTTGVSTDISGAYTITVPDAGKAVLVFSSLGMAEVEEKVSGRAVINVLMSEDRNYLDEVVVVGYGQQKKVHMTGSVAAVSSNELKKMTVANVSQSLVGKLPGLITQQGTGGPGQDAVSILVRGYSSYNDSGSPLVLVDGVERNMNTVNPSDIESVSVLKDAASCAVYGMKAANGVILITTKRGDDGNVTISYNGRLTLNTPTALPKMMNGTQYMQYYNLGYQLDQEANGIPLDQTTPYFSAEEIAATYNGNTADGLENTDWTAPLYRTTIMHQHNVSVTGGSQKVKYFLSGGFNKQNGFLDDHYNKRTNVRSNIDVNVNKNLRVTLSLGGYLQDYNNPGYLEFANGQTGGTVPFCLMYALPFVPHYYNGIATSPMRTRDSFVANAEYGAKNSGFRKTRTTSIETSADIAYKIPFVKGLKADLFYSWDYKHVEAKTFAHAYEVMAYQFSDRSYQMRTSSGLLLNGNLYMGRQQYWHTVLRPQISYEREFGKHAISAIALYECVKNESDNLTASRQNFELFSILELAYGDSKTASNSSSRGHDAYAGYVGRINYRYADKYLFETAFRYDGSYRFKNGYKWGFFPSVSAGWVMSKEPFFKDALPSIDMFKVRGSLGEVGNDNVTPWLWAKEIVFNANSVAFGQTAQSTLYNKNAYTDPTLTWERIRTADIGFEMNAWKGLLGVEFDWFYKLTYNILTSPAGSYASSLGGNVPTKTNDGMFDNRGFEIALSHANHVGKFSYKISGNMSWAHNKIIKQTQSPNVLPWQSVIGHSIGDVWGLVSDGLFQSQEEIDNSPLPLGVTPKVGDIKYKDINGDGRITSDDRVKIARGPRPELMYSVQFDANYMGFDLAVQIQGAALRDRMLLGSWANGVTDANPLVKPWYANYDNAPLYLVEGAWRPDNTDAEYPRLSANGSSYSNNYTPSDFWKRNGAYVRLKNVSLGYTVPSKILKKVNCAGLRVFASGINLLTFSGFKYLDPENDAVITAYYPQQRTVTFGIDLSF